MFIFITYKIMTANEIIQLLGVLYLVMGVSFIFNKKYYRNLFKDMIKSNIFKFLGWYIALVIGFIREFTFSKEWLITILWWIAFLKWIILLRFPGFFTKFSKIFTKKENFNVISYMITILGGWFIYLGYFL